MKDWATVMKKKLAEELWKLSTSVSVSASKFADELRLRNQREPAFADGATLNCGSQIRETNKYLNQQIIGDDCHKCRCCSIV
ncbi:hypothetical protein L484_023426 [Morus notabilis]|uniref:Uncharacterized protein n=1 Tax=Morus notabilis TaxID=981085 RepID=W9RDJ2_9ROSA|nr:hypothetical protein L484_023426 [Morus notabilis]